MGKNDKRDLWSECARMLREIRPETALFENVQGLLNSNGGKFFNSVMSDISASGYDAEWQIISAEEVGAPHKRERVWIVAYPQSERLLENETIPDYGMAKRKTVKENAEWKLLRSVVARTNKMEHWKEHEQIITGDYDGLPEELDRIRGAGNAIVPQCAELIFNLPVFDKWRKYEGDKTV